MAQQGKEAGCRYGWQYAELHNSGYRGLYAGLDANGVKNRKGLTEKQELLDHMCAAEGAANVFRVTQAKIAMEQRRPASPEAAYAISHEAGVVTREAMRQIGGVMPEDMAPADHIGRARKRLEQNRRILAED